jgi:polyamine oxidase
VTRWGKDPFARGAYSYLAVGASAEDRAALAEPLGPRLILAGEATSVEHPSTVHGAWLSGIAAAERLLEMA